MKKDSNKIIYLLFFFSIGLKSANAQNDIEYYRDFFQKIIHEAILTPFKSDFSPYLSKNEAKKLSKLKVVIDSGSNNNYTFYTDNFKNDSFLIVIGFGFMIQLSTFPLLHLIGDSTNNSTNFTFLYLRMRNILFFESPFEFCGTQKRSDTAFYKNYLQYHEKYMFSILFMFLHELGHIINGDLKFKKKSTQNSKQVKNRELSADKWATNLLLKYYIDHSIRKRKNIIPRYFIPSIALCFKFFFVEHDSKSLFSKNYFPEFEREKNIYNVVKKKLCGDSLFIKICKPLDSSITLDEFDAEDLMAKKRNLDILNEDTGLVFQRIRYFSQKLDDYIEFTIKNPDDTLHHLNIDSFNFNFKGKLIIIGSGREEFAYSLLYGNWYYPRNLKLALSMFELMANSSTYGLWFDYFSSISAEFKIEEFNLICANLYQYSTEKNIKKAIFYYKQAMKPSKLFRKSYYEFKLQYLENK